MTAAEHIDRRTEDVLDRSSAPPEHPPVVERLETALGGDLTRFLLSALAGAQAPSRGEPR